MRNMGRRIDRRSLTDTIAVACLVGAGVVGGGVANATEAATSDPVEAEVAQSDAETGDETDPRAKFIEQKQTTIASLGVNDASTTDAAAIADDPVISGTWGQAPWTFEDGVLTVTGNTDPANPYTLDRDTRPWRGSPPR